jgi:hypothetical protein
MPTLKLIDIMDVHFTKIVDGVPATSTEQKKDEQEFEVTDRQAAYRILKYDLAATSDPAWANSIKIAFDVNGENNITMPNGDGLAFQVLYEE